MSILPHGAFVRGIQHSCLFAKYVWYTIHMVSSLGHWRNIYALRGGATAYGSSFVCLFVCLSGIPSVTISLCQRTLKVWGLKLATTSRTRYYLAFQHLKVSYECFVLELWHGVICSPWRPLQIKQTNKQTNELPYAVAPLPRHKYLLHCEPGDGKRERRDRRKGKRKGDSETEWI